MVKVLNTTDIDQDLRTHLRNHFTNETNSAFKKWLLNHIPLHNTFLYQKGQLVGWCAVNPETWTIGVYIHPDHRGKGLATKAVKERLKQLKRLPEPPKSLIAQPSRFPRFKDLIEKKGFNFTPL